MDREGGRPALWTRDFVLIVGVNFLLAFGYQLFPSTQPLYIKGLGATDNVIGWLTGITTVATLITRPLTGAVLDRFNRKGVFLLGLGMVITTTFAYYFFPVVGVILAIRFLQGIAWGITSTATVTSATDMIPRKRFGEGLGIFGLSTSLPLAVAPGVALAVFGAAGMRPLVLLGTALGLCSLLLALLVRFPGVEKHNRPVSAFPYEKASIPPAAVMGLVLLPYGAVSTFLALYAQQKGVGNIGVFFAVYAGTVLLTRPIAGKLADRIGFGTAVPVGAALMLLGLILLPLASSLWMFLVAAALYGASYGTLEPNLHALAVTRAPQGRSGAANATFSTGVDLGIGIGAVMAGLVASAAGYERMFFILPVFPVIMGGAFFAFGLFRPVRKTAEALPHAPAPPSKK